MYIVLLSGGSGKRLWPLSNTLRSKQYIKLLHNEQTGEPCSMVQRVWRQLEKAGLDANTMICASRSQTEILQRQLGRKIPIAVEPARRDTAAALSCAFLKSKLGASEADPVCFLPVDPYTDDGYFETVKRLPQVLDETGAQIALMGVTPDHPSDKYGYIIPDGAVLPTGTRVRAFSEKPTVERAAALIADGALWNCGVFCLRIGDVLECLAEYDLPTDYDSLFQNYDRLPKTSFDYAVLERAEQLTVVPFCGMWKDLGTWDVFCEELRGRVHGNGLMDPSCRNTSIINESTLPVVTVGTQDLIVVCAPDGVLVTERAASVRLKEVVERLDDRLPMYEERRWGTIQVLNCERLNGGRFSMTRRLHVFAGHNLSYHVHDRRDEVWTFLQGEGTLAQNGEMRDCKAGDTVRIAGGTPHSLLAKTDVVFLETQIGDGGAAPDVRKLTLNWDEIPQCDKCD